MGQLLSEYRVPLAMMGVFGNQMEGIGGQYCECGKCHWMVPVKWFMLFCESLL